MGGNSQTVSWRQDFLQKTIAWQWLTPGSEINVSRKLLRLSLNVDKEEGVHATLLIVFVPSKDFAFGLEFLDIVKTTFVWSRWPFASLQGLPRADLRPVQDVVYKLDGWRFKAWPAPRSRWSPWASWPSLSSRPPPGTPSPWVSGLLLGSPARLKWE